ncbi:MFS transporter [Ktedonosporobacter rubrisoli]|uniref:MFS transporter n=1 Tax=Ktedonosporobacter rubrisoli TaxID=2509675 RepID=A0A4P6JL76_KTERU|nr:MFS transporter [Ktedonosporobacter rubrisoli]QBD75948.1 MFS transporter [Ktedonosporobacter rubrisoli]
MKSTTFVSSRLEETREPVLERKLIGLLAITAGMTVANLYYSQPLLADIAHSFALSASEAGFWGTLTQLGYGLGLLLIVPLGDSLERRFLMVLLLLLEAGALLGTAFASNTGWMSITSFAVGFLTVVPQLILPFAASLAPDEKRARIVGTVLSGILIGILLARTVSGFLGAELGWRAMYGIAAGLMLVLALILWRTLPRQPVHGSASYLQLLASLWNIVRTEPALRPICLFGALTFAAFNMFWVTLAFFLKTPPYHFGSAVVGLFGIVGIVGAVAAPQVGKLADRTGKPRLTIGLGLLIVLLAFGVFWLFGSALWGLIVGVILLDLGAQSALTSCQAIVQGLRSEARSRLNTIFMTTYFLGGAVGSTLGSYGWDLGKWAGICMIGMVLLLSALIAFLLTSRSAHRS